MTWASEPSTAKNWWSTRYNFWGRKEGKKNRNPVKHTWFAPCFSHGIIDI